MVETMRSAYRVLCRTEAIVAGAFLVAMVLLIFLGGVARLAHMPLNWTTDLATCLFAWACFLCADIAWRNGGLMAIELVTERLSERARSFQGIPDVSYSWITMSLPVGAALLLVTTVVKVLELRRMTAPVAPAPTA